MQAAWVLIRLDHMEKTKQELATDVPLALKAGSVVVALPEASDEAELTALQTALAKLFIVSEVRRWGWDVLLQRRHMMLSNVLAPFPGSRDTLT